MPLSQEACIQMAISAFNLNQFKSVRAAAEVFDVPKLTLYDRLYGSKSRNKSRANNLKLLDIKEKTLIKHLLNTNK